MQAARVAAASGLWRSRERHVLRRRKSRAGGSGEANGETEGEASDVQKGPGEEEEQMREAGQTEESQKVNPR